MSKCTISNRANKKRKLLNCSCLLIFIIKPFIIENKYTWKDIKYTWKDIKYTWKDIKYTWKDIKYTWKDIKYT